MAQFIQVRPISHIHLLMGEPAANLTVLLDSGTDFTGAVIASDFDAAKVQAQKLSGPFRFELTPVAVGETIGKLTFTEATKNHVVLVRVQVHSSISQFWIGNNRATVPAPSNSVATRMYQLTVYARFDDNTFGDVTSHPYLSFASDNDTIVHVDQLGRLEGRGTTGQKTNIKVTHKGTTHSIEVTVGDPLNKVRKILKPVTVPVPGGGSSVPTAANSKERRNILLVAEGFTQAEEAEFNQWVKECIEKRLFATAALSHTPFHLLGNGINVWTAFEPSSESGISVGPPIKKSLNATTNTSEATPIPTNAANPVNETIDGFFQAKDSRYGFFYGARTGERTSRADRVNWFNPPQAHRQLDIDPRRLDDKQDVKAFLDSYLASLQTAAGDAVGQERWVSGKPDEGLICILVNDDHQGGLARKTMNTAVLVEIGTFLSVALGVNRKFTLKSGVAAPLLDHDPTTAPATANNQVPLLELTTEVLSHELSHYLGLGDEYEDVDQRGQTELPANQATDIKIVDNKTNLTPFILVNNNNQVDADKIKWNWDRIELASTCVKDATTPAGSPDTIEVELKAGQGTLWTVVKTANKTVFLRHPDLNKVRPERLFVIASTAQFETDLNNGTVSANLKQEFTQKQIALSASPTVSVQKAGTRWLLVDNERNFPLRKEGTNLEAYSNTTRLLGPLTISNINQDVLTLKGAKINAPGDFPRGSTVYLPKRTAGKIDTLIHPSVSSHISLQGALVEKSGVDCNQPVPDAVPTKPAKPNIANFTFPRDWWTTIGLYEGGGTWNCSVYRPTLLCRMRNISIADRRTFCFACRYALVDLIDASQHPRLDTEYP